MLEEVPRTKFKIPITSWSRLFTANYSPYQHCGTIPYIFHTVCTRFRFGLVILQLLNWYHQLLNWYNWFTHLQRIILMTWKMPGYQHRKYLYIIAIKIYSSTVNSTEFCWGQLKMWNMVHKLYKKSVSLFGQWILMSEIKSLYAEVKVPRKHINASLPTRGEQLSNLGYLLQAWPRMVLGITMAPATVAGRVARLVYPVSKQHFISSMPENNDLFV